MEFSTLKEFNKAYNQLRKDIMIRHNVQEWTKAMLKNAIMLYENINCQWLKRTSVKSDMTDHIKLYEVLKKQGQFKLVAMV